MLFYMKNLLFLALFALLPLTARSQGSTPYWLDPAQNRVNTVAPRADFFAFESTALAMQGDKTRSARYLSLEGPWKFHFARHHQDAPAKFFETTFDDSAWITFQVPGLFELYVYFDPIFFIFFFSFFFFFIVLFFFYFFFFFLFFSAFSPSAFFFFLLFYLLLCDFLF